MITGDIVDLSRRVKAAQGHGRLFLSFSTGVDAIASFLRCIESDEWNPKEAVLYYYHHVPMSWTLEYIEYFEDRYGVKVIRVPSHIFLSDLANWLYQEPVRAEAIQELQKTMYAFRAMKKDQIQDGVRMWSRLPESTMCGVGVKQGDSPMRRTQMRKYLGISPRGKWYPIWDFEHRDVEDIIRRHGVKVPYDYELFGISYENIDYRFSKVISEQCPNNWEKILEWFPLADTIISRHEYYTDRPPKKGMKYQRFSDIILQPREAL